MMQVFCLCPEGFVLGPDWKNCDDVDECAAGDFHRQFKMINRIIMIIKHCYVAGYDYGGLTNMMMMLVAMIMTNK